ncbi:hypothetical protein KP001_07715 [Geomonas subterranea]|uniref:Uncharacterized protein n=1 Tax=Geomonas subterranea TaxID=2847989 RepID=A0ABX8LP53_9BACT|nr:hypothetical protein [Geomonas subterranea]QXE92399.1 hypothetical protein KP001_07715 [Geomonas subterranea]QXM09502.1 hypothetical protein KP002_21555 [Geomonas subterranea]
MKRVILFLGKILLFSLLLMPAVGWFEGIYQGVLQAGIATPRTIPFAGGRAILLFFVLILATPDVTVKKRCAGIFGAILLYLLIDRLMIYLWGVLPYAQKPGAAAQAFYTQVYYMFMHWLLPFLLWLLIAFREVEEVLRMPKVE